MGREFQESPEAIRIPELIQLQHVPLQIKAHIGSKPLLSHEKRDTVKKEALYIALGLDESGRKEILEVP